MHQIRFKEIQALGEFTGEWQCHGKVTAIEVLDCGNSHHIHFVFNLFGKLWRYNQHLMALFAIFTAERIYRSRNTTHMREVGVGEHDDIHRGFSSSISVSLAGVSGW